MTNSIAQNEDLDKGFKSSILNFFSDFHFSNLLHLNNFKKIEGISCFKVIKNIFLLIFKGKNWYRIYTDENENPGFEKDVVYRFLNSFKYNWENLLTAISTKVVSWLTCLTNEDRVPVLIADDTFFDRTRSKAVELLSWVYDHVDGKFKKGFTKLTLGWSDGATYIPLFFQLLCASKEEKLLRKAEHINQKYPGYLRREKAKQKKTDLLFEMVRTATNNSIFYKYLLFDRWFAFPAIIMGFKQMGTQIITMAKNTPKIFYEYQGKYMTLSKIYSKIKKTLNKNTRMVVEACMCNFSQEMKTKVQIVFIKNEKTKSWVALLTTDLSLPAEEIIRIYGIRWDIEIFFKMCKSFLKLAKEFQGRSYDMLVAHTTIVYLRYIMLAVAARKNQDGRTFGELFFLYCDEIRDITFSEALNLIFSMLKQFIKEKFALSENQVAQLLNSFIDSLPPFLGKFFLPKWCES